jgi:hypothetical protein
MALLFYGSKPGNLNKNHVSPGTALEYLLPALLTQSAIRLVIRQPPYPAKYR